MHGQGQKKTNKSLQQRTLSGFITIPLYLINYVLSMELLRLWRLKNEECSILGLCYHRVPRRQPITLLHQFEFIILIIFCVPCSWLPRSKFEWQGILRLSLKLTIMIRSHLFVSRNGTVIKDCIWSGLLKKLIECLNSQVPQQTHPMFTRRFKLVYASVTFTTEV